MDLPKPIVLEIARLSQAYALCEGVIRRVVSNIEVIREVVV